MIAKPKWENFTLPEVETVNILRDPPKSLSTRKSEKVDVGNVRHMYDADRIADGINFYARGVNPMVSVDYSGLGGGSQTNSLNTGQAWSPYVVNRDGDFRFPLVYQNDRLPLSRMARPNYALPATVTMPFVDLQRPIKALDRDTVKTSVYPTYQYITDALNIMDNNVKRGINDVKPNIVLESVRDLTSLGNDNTNRSPIDLRDTNIIAYVTPKTNIIIETNGIRQSLEGLNLRDKEHIAIMADKHLPIETVTNDQTIKLKDYSNIAVESNKTGEYDIVIHNPQVTLSKNLLAISPLLSNISNNLIDVEPERKAKLAEEQPLKSGNLFSQAYVPFQYDKSVREYNLPHKIQVGPFDNPSTIILPPQDQQQSQYNLAGVRDKSVYNRYQDYNDRFRTYSQQM